jgi:hypothetical protein
MTTRSETYQRKAEEAERSAERATDPAAKEIYRELAAQWRELALEAARHNW